MQIILKLHAVQRYMQYHNIASIKKANELLKSAFINIYWFGEIKQCYNCKQEVSLNDEKMVFSESNGDYNIITYILSDTGTKQYYKRIRNHKLKVKKEHKFRTYKT